MIVFRKLIIKLYPQRDASMQCHTQAGNITTNLKVEEIIHYLNLAQPEP